MNYLLLLLCLWQLTFGKRELEIGIITFEHIKGTQIYNQLVRFDVPFTKLPKVAISLINHTPTKTLFAKVNNITQNNFIISFFSADTLNATYRYMATTDESIYVNCSNFRASSQITVPTSTDKIVAFLTGYHHAGYVSVSIANQNEAQSSLMIKTNDVKQTAVGVCLIAGKNIKENSSENSPSFSGLVSSDGEVTSLFIEGTNIILLIEVQQVSEPAFEQINEPKKHDELNALKSYIDDQIKPNLRSKSKQIPKIEESISTCETEQEEENVDDLPEDEQINEEMEPLSISEDSDDLSEEEEDFDYFENNNSQKKQSSIDFELQLSLLQDALKKNSDSSNQKSQQQQVIKEIINANPKEQKKQKQKKVEIAKPKEKKQTVDQEIVEEKPKQELNNEQIDVQLHQKEQHLTSLKKALNLIDQFQEKKLEVVEQIKEEQEEKEEEIKENIEQTITSNESSAPSKPTGYMSPLIDDIPSMSDYMAENKKEKKITFKLDGYMQSFSEDNIVKYKKKEEKKQEKESNIKIQENTQLIELTGQNTKIVYEASEESLRKFEEDFERRKQQKMQEIKQQLLPENKLSKSKFQSLAQEDETLKSYKDFFYN